MPDRDEIVRSLTGAWTLFLDRADAMRFFNVSIDGFWRSFYAILLILPAYLIVVVAERARIFSEPATGVGFDGGAFFINKILMIGLDWVTLPIILALVAGPLGVARTYVPYVVARNWAAVLATTPFGIIELFYLLGLIGSGVAGLIALVVLVIVIRYNYLIARRALGADIGLAVGLIIADLAISLVVVGVADGLVSYQPAIS